MKFMLRRVVLYLFFLICVYHISYSRAGSAESTKVTEEGLSDLSKNVTSASEMLEIASLSLRAAYVRADSSVYSFVNLRSSVTNEAKVYSIKILPIATTLIRNLQEFSEIYDAISFDEFKEVVHELAEEAKENVNFSKYVLELHKAVSTEFKKLGDKAEIVLRELQMETQRYEAKLNELRRRARKKDDLALGLAFIPFVNIIALPIIASEQDNIIAQQIAIGEEKEIAVAAAKAIKETLVGSIEGFEKAIGAITQFFEILHSELIIFSDRHEKFDENKVKMAKIHFILIKKKAATLVSACRFFMSRIPEFETNLMAIPNNHDRSYVQEWLSKKQAKIDGEDISFFELAKKWFGSSKKIANLLGLPSYNNRIEL